VDYGPVTDYGPNPINYGPHHHSETNQNNYDTEAITGVQKNYNDDDTDTYSHASSVPPETEDNYPADITGVPEHMDQEEGISGDDVTDKGTM